VIPYIGIDPGVNGGIAVVDGVHATAWKMPDSAHDLAAILRALDSARIAVVEKVASSPQMGVVSAFTFGRGLGEINGVLAALRIKRESVSPAKWQRAMGCLTGGDKAITRAAALRLWPRLTCAGWLCDAELHVEPVKRVTNAVADALLIAEWGRRAGL
jgi:hypothetical protein